MASDYDSRKETLMLEIGTPLQLEIKGFSTRFKSSLVGALPDEYLIVTAPKLTMFVGQPKHLLPESEVVVRYVHRGNAWGFQSKLTRVISTPAKLLVLEYPSEIENFNLRSDERIECLLPGGIELQKAKRKGVVLDISIGGCRFSFSESKEPIDVAVDAELKLRCQLPGIEGDQEFEGRVKRVEKDKMRTVLGIEFNNVEQKIQALITQYSSAVSDTASQP
jgi:hypothetical protein